MMMKAIELTEKYRIKRSVPIAICFAIWLAAILYNYNFMKNTADMVFISSIITFQLIAAYCDLCTRLIPLGLILAALLTGSVLIALFDMAALKGHLLGGGAALAILIILILISRGQLGGGDMLLMSVTGFFTGISPAIGILFISIVISGLFSVFLMLAKKWDYRTEIPFAPFILIATALISINICV